MPKNCSADVTLVINYVDSILTKGTSDEVYALKEMFGLEGVEHNDDFAAVLENGPWLWQSNSFYTGYSGFYQFCDAVENAVPGSGIPTPASGVGLTKALAGYASWINSTIVPTSMLHPPALSLLGKYTDLRSLKPAKIMDMEPEVLNVSIHTTQI